MDRINEIQFLGWEIGVLKKDFLQILSNIWHIWWIFKVLEVWLYCKLKFFAKCKKKCLKNPKPGFRVPDPSLENISFTSFPLFCAWPRFSFQTCQMSNSPGHLNIQNAKWARKNSANKICFFKNSLFAFFPPISCPLNAFNTIKQY